MTIYDIEMNPVNLRGLRSTRLVADLCLLISGDIIRHLSVTLFNYCPAGTQALTGYVTTLQWYLGLLGRATSAQVEVDPHISVHKISFKKKNEGSLMQEHEFNLESLGVMDSRLLLEFLTQLMFDTLSCIGLNLPHTSDHLFRTCSDKARDILRDLSFLVGKLPNGSTSRNGLMIPELESIRILVEVRDQREGTKVLNKNLYFPDEHSMAPFTG